MLQIGDPRGDQGYTSNGLTKGAKNGYKMEIHMGIEFIRIMGSQREQKILQNGDPHGGQGYTNNVLTREQKMFKWGLAWESRLHRQCAHKGAKNV